MNSENEEMWYQMLAKGNNLGDQARAVFEILPADPRCMFCHSPFQGYGGRIMRLIGKGQSREDPRLCNACIRHGQEHPGGAHVDVAMVFADVRGSTPMAERLGDRAFSQLIDRFFRVSADAIIHSGGFVDRLAGDAAIGFFVPGLSGPEFPRRALECGKKLLRVTGSGDRGGPWIPVGVGVHLGNAFVGMVGTPKGITNFTALGDDINVGARIASAAGPGELLASLELCRQAGIEMESLVRRSLSLKGKQSQEEVALIPVR